MFETVPFHHLFARCQFYDENPAEFDEFDHAWGNSKNYTLEANQQGVLCAGAIQVTMAFPIFVEVDGGENSLRNLKIGVGHKQNPNRLQYNSLDASQTSFLRKCSVHSDILEGCSCGIVFMVLFPWQPLHVGTEPPTGTLWSKGQPLESDRPMSLPSFQIHNFIDPIMLSYSIHNVNVIAPFIHIKSYKW